MLIRAWGLLGAVSAVLVVAGVLITLRRAGWHPGDPTGPGEALHHAYRQATTVTFAGIAACQIGTAALSPPQLAVIAPLPLIVWGVDEAVRWMRRTMTKTAR